MKTSRRTMMEFRWNDKKCELVFGEMPNEQELLKIADQSLRVAGWYAGLRVHHRMLRKVLSDSRLSELATNVTIFWYEWLSYEHIPAGDKKSEWLGVIRPARLSLICALAKRCGTDNLERINKLVLYSMLPFFGTDENGILRAERACQQLQEGGMWWPFDIPISRNSRASREPDALDTISA